MNPKMYDLKIDVSCEVSVNFQHMSQKAAPATEFARCHHLTQPWQCDSQKTHNTTRLECCACHAKWIWTRPKCCTCYEKWKSSSENDAKYCPCKIKHRSTCYETCWTATKCHACHAKRGYATFEPPKVTTLAAAELTIYRPGHTVLTRTVADGCERLRTVADGCGRLRTVAQRLANTASTPKPGTLATHSGKGKK